MYKLYKPLWSALWKIYRLEYARTHFFQNTHHLHCRYTVNSYKYPILNNSKHKIVPSRILEKVYETNWWLVVNMRNEKKKKRGEIYLQFLGRWRNCFHLGNSKILTSSSIICRMFSKIKISLEFFFSKMFIKHITFT